MAAKTINITLKIWRQKNSKAKGELKSYALENVSTDSSFLEMLDQLNEELLTKKEEPVAFDHDCREGICGSCSLYINGRAHGPETGTTTCQLHMRKFKDGENIYIEPWRSAAFPIIKDLIVDRSASDSRIPTVYLCRCGHFYHFHASSHGAENRDKPSFSWQPLLT